MIREDLNQIVFGTDTKWGKRFDVFLLYLILFSVVVVMLESVPEIGAVYSDTFITIEWVMTILFTIEYLLRLWISHKPYKYITSFWGVIDFLSILPTYLSLFIVGYHYLLIVRIFRLLRIFRILKLARFSSESSKLLSALKSSSYKISVFLSAVVAIVIFMGTIMYVIEGGEKGFESIPESIYWAVVTVTTVGYGDVIPHSVLGKFISSIAMIFGYAIIAVPTGIMTVEMSKTAAKKNKCSNCDTDYADESNYCSECGASLEDN